MIAWLKRTFLYSSDDPPLDHVPVGSLDCRTPEAVAKAKEKLGRPFIPEINVARITPPSHQLNHINEQTELAKRVKATVTSIEERRRK